MKRLVLVFLLLLLSSVRNAEPVAGPANPKNITIRILTFDAVRRATITPMGSGNWIRTCSTCDAQPVSDPMYVDVSSGQIRLDRGSSSKQLELHGTFRFKPDTMEYAPSTTGDWKIRASGSSMQLLLTIPLENYVKAVLSGEAAPDEPFESLKALAVVIRTFALVNINRHTSEGFGLCDTTHCQVARFIKFRPDVERAVQETRGETLWAAGQLAGVTFTEHCGGTTEDANNVWNSSHHFSYLVSHPDAYCVRRSPAEWHSQMTLSQLASVGKREGWHLPAHIEEIEVTKHAPTGRAMSVEFRGEDSHTTLQAVAFRYAVDRAMGLYQIRSDWYTVTLKDGILSFVGKGYGHGVGLCQAGSYEMAVEGKSYRDILDFYYPTTEIRTSPKPADTKEPDEIAEPTPAPPVKKAVGEDALWTKAQELFPSPGAVRPVLHIAETGQEFQKLTDEPAWTPGAAKEKDVYLQTTSVYPDVIAREDVLLRQYLLALVHQAAAEKVRPWLRVGLAEALAGPTQQVDISGITPVAIDAMLAHPADAAAWTRAHAVAGIFVQRILRKHGLTTPRGWLKSGPPAFLNDFYFPSAQSSSPVKRPSAGRKTTSKETPKDSAPEDSRPVRQASSKKKDSAEVKTTKSASAKTQQEATEDEERPSKSKQKTEAKAAHESKPAGKEPAEKKKPEASTSKKTKEPTAKSSKDEKEQKASSDSKTKKDADKDSTDSKTPAKGKHRKSKKPADS